MKVRNQFILAAIFSFIFYAGVQAGQPIAPVIKISDVPPAIFEGIEQGDWDLMIEEITGRFNDEIPTRAEVGIPVPPDVFFSGIGRMKLNGQKKSFVNLLTEDLPKNVREFYQSSLHEMPGWQWSEEFNMFYKAEDRMDIEQLLSSPIPVIEVKEIFPDDPFVELMLFFIDAELKSRLNTLIQVTYSFN